MAVVGAGPAGSRTARNIAAKGFRVRLLEEHRQIGVPSHCSGLISPRTLKEAEIGEDAILHRITGAFVHSPDGSEAGLGGNADRAVAIDRVRWDRTLCEQAQHAGAELLRARVVHVEREDGGVRVHTQAGERSGSFTARLVVGADGTHSRVARSLGLPPPRERVHCLGVEGRLFVPRDDFVHVFVGRDLAPGWFGWIIPTGDGGVRAGIGCLPDGRSGAPVHKPIACYRRLTEAFPRLFGGMEPRRWYGGTIPLEFAPQSFGDNVLLAGDAAGQVKPFSGGGIYTGLVAARHAAAAAVDALHAGDVSAAGLSSYERRWKREIGRELMRSRRLRHVGLMLTDSEVDRIVQTLRGSELQSLAARHGDIDYPSRVLLRLARSGPALQTLWRLATRRPSAAWELLRAYVG